MKGSDSIFGEEYESAKGRDFNKYNNKKYSNILNVINQEISKILEHKNEETIGDEIISTRKAINNSLGAKVYKKSELKNWALEILKKIETNNISENEVHNIKIKEEKDRKVKDKGIETNKFIIDTYENEKFEDVVKKMINLVKYNDTNINLINISTIINKLKNINEDKCRGNEYNIKLLLNHLTKLLNESEEKIAEKSVGNILFGLKNLNTDVVSRDLLCAITKKMEEMEEKMTIQGISNAFYGLRNLNSDIVPIKLINFLTKKIEESKDNFNKQSISNILYGLKNLNEKIISKRLLLAITEKITESTDVFDEQSIGNSLYGLINMNNDIVPKKLLIAISEKINESNILFNQQSISNAFYGLRNLNSDTVPEELISSLTKKIKELKSLSGQSCGNILYGMKNLDSTIITKELLMIITEKINNYKEEYDEQNIGNSLYGLKNLDKRVVPRELIIAISDKMKNIEGGFKEQTIANSLYGLKGLDSTIVTDELLTQLTVKIKGIDKINSQAISNGLYGLQNLEESIITTELIKEIEIKLDKLLEKGEDKFNIQNISNSLYGIYNNKNSCKKLVNKLFNEVKNIKTQDIDMINTYTMVQVYSMYEVEIPENIKIKYEEYKKNNSTAQSKTEGIIFNYINKHYEGVEFKTNTFLDGFEMDIYIPEYNINIELDSPVFHEKKKTKDNKRDKYLKDRKGISVFRINLSENGYMEGLRGMLDSLQ